MQMYYQNEPKFNGVYSRDNLLDKIKDGAYVINLDEYSDIGTHLVALYVNNKTVTNFESFGVEHIPKEIKKFINDKNIIANIFRIRKFNERFRFLLCAIDIFSKYAWVVPLKDRKGVSIVNAFQIILKDYNKKPNKNFIIDLLKNGYKTMVLMCIQHITLVNQL